MKRERLEKRVTTKLNELGIPTKLRGFYYLREAIVDSFEDAVIIYPITKSVYPALAEKFKTTDIRVERAMRYAIEVCWKKNPSHFKEWFGINFLRRPTNTEFIALFVDKLRLDI